MLALRLRGLARLVSMRMLLAAAIDSRVRYMLVRQWCSLSQRMAATNSVTPAVEGDQMAATYEVVSVDAAAVQQRSPSAYGVFNILYNGRLFCYHYLGPKELKQLDTLLQQA